MVSGARVGDHKDRDGERGGAEGARDSEERPDDHAVR